MAKTKLTYTVKDKKPHTEFFRCIDDAKDHLAKLEKNMVIVSSSITEIEKKESALHVLGRSLDK